MTLLILMLSIILLALILWGHFTVTVSNSSIANRGKNAMLAAPPDLTLESQIYDLVVRDRAAGLPKDQTLPVMRLLINGNE